MILNNSTQLLPCPACGRPPPVLRMPRRQCNTAVSRFRLYSSHHALAMTDRERLRECALLTGRRVCHSPLSLYACNRTLTPQRKRQAQTGAPKRPPRTAVGIDPTPSTETLKRPQQKTVTLAQSPQTGAPPRPRTLLTLALSCPQPASMSMPRRTRGVAATPYSASMSTKTCRIGRGLGLSVRVSGLRA